MVVGDSMGLMEWKLGDRLVHSGMPEWGLGEVRAAESISHEGRKAQRLTVRFDRAGVKIISTAFADLRPATGAVQAPPAGTPEPEDSADRAAAEARLAQIPEAATDPFRTRKTRLEATVGLYRFTATGGSLLDWAAAQTGLKDPLSRFSRHELERGFDRFRTNLDAHLRKLVFELKKEDPAALARICAAAGPAARQALKRADAGR
jgi:hypothetical protein